MPCVLTFESLPGQVGFGKKTEDRLQSTLATLPIKSPVPSGACDVGSVDVKPLSWSVYVKPLSGTVVTSTSNSSSSQVLSPVTSTKTQ